MSDTEKDKDVTCFTVDGVVAEMVIEVEENQKVGSDDLKDLSSSPTKDDKKSDDSALVINKDGNEVDVLDTEKADKENLLEIIESEQKNEEPVEHKKLDESNDSIADDKKSDEINEDIEELNEIDDSSMEEENFNMINIKNSQNLKGKRKHEENMDSNESDNKDSGMSRYPGRKRLANKRYISEDMITSNRKISESVDFKENSKGIKKRKVEEDSKENEEVNDVIKVSTTKSHEKEQNLDDTEELDTSKEFDKINLNRSLRNKKADSEKPPKKQNVLRKLPFRKNKDAPDIPEIKPKVFWLNGVGQGQGIKLGDIPEIKERIAKAKSIRALYRVLFFQWPTNGQDLIGQILEFNGFPFDESSYEFSKRQSIMKIMLDKTIFHMCELLDIRKGDKNSNIRNILDFLMKPYAKIDPAQDPAWQPVVVIEKMELDDTFFDQSSSSVKLRRGRPKKVIDKDVKSSTATPTRSTRSSGPRKIEIVLDSESEKNVKKTQENVKTSKVKSSSMNRSGVKEIDKPVVKASTSTAKVSTPASKVSTSAAKENASPVMKKKISSLGIKDTKTKTSIVEKNAKTTSAKETKEKSTSLKKENKPHPKEENRKTERIENSESNKPKQRQKLNKKKKMDATSIKNVSQEKEKPRVQSKEDSYEYEIEMTFDSEPDEDIETENDESTKTATGTTETVQQNTPKGTEITHKTRISTVNLSDSSETESAEETKLMTASKKSTKIPLKRKGKPLRHFPKISDSIQNANFSALQRLHILLFGASDKAENLKSNILSFGGFPFLEGSDEWKQKHFLLSLLAQNNLKEYLNLLCIPHANDDQPTMINKLMRFLAVPSEESFEHRIQPIETEVISSVLVDKSSSVSIKGKVETKKKIKKKDEKKVSKRPRKVLMSEEEARRLEANFAREQRALSREKKLPSYRPIAQKLPITTTPLNMHTYIPPNKSPKKPPTTDPEQLNALLQTVYKRRALKDAGAIVSTPNKGQKTRLGNIENIKFLIVTSNLSDLEILHRLIFMLESSKSRVRKNILDFNGFGFNEDSPKYKHRMDYLKSLGYEASKRISFLLGLCPLNTSLPQQDLNELIMYFLMSPCKTKQTVPITQMPIDEPHIFVKSTAPLDKSFYLQKASLETALLSEKVATQHSTPLPKTGSQKARKTFPSSSKLSPVKKVLLPPSQSPALGTASLGNKPQKIMLLNSIPAVPAFSLPKSTVPNPLTNLTLLNTGGLILNAPKSPGNPLLKVPVVSPGSKMQVLNQSSKLAVLEPTAGKIPVNLSNIPTLLQNQVLIPQISLKNSTPPTQVQMPLLPGTKMASKTPTAVLSPQEFIVQQKAPDGQQRTFKLIKLPPNHPLLSNKPPVQQTASSLQLPQQLLFNAPFTGTIPPGLVIMKNNVGLPPGQNLQLLPNAPMKLLPVSTPGTSVSPAVSSPLSKIAPKQAEEVVSPDGKESISESANTSLDNSVEAMNSSEDTAPTDDDLFSSIQEIILSSNFEDITLRNVIDRVAAQYSNHDLTHRHNYMKECVKKIIIGT